MTKSRKRLSPSEKLDALEKELLFESGGGVSTPGIFTRGMELASTFVSRPHVVILGAGASVAAEIDWNGTRDRLPLMFDLVGKVGLSDLITSVGLDSDSNFEDVYSELSALPSAIGTLTELNGRIDNYFAAIRLPNKATIYDNLIMSLRAKDVIATFNWDGLLWEAYWRVFHTLRSSYGPERAISLLPELLFLHGNIAIGICGACQRLGHSGDLCKKCGSPLGRVPLLYPVREKDYQQSPFIAYQWERLQVALKKAYLVTIFGYAAPKSDVAAIAAMKSAWRQLDSRDLEQIEFIDLIGEDELIARWDDFVYSHHYNATSEFWKSSLARHPRRTCEYYCAQLEGAMWGHNGEEERLQSDDVESAFRERYAARTSFELMHRRIEPLPRYPDEDA